MKFPRSTTRLIAAAFALSVTIPTVGIASIVPAQAAPISSNCETGTKDLIATQKVQKAASAQGAVINYTCINELATVEVLGSSGKTTALLAETTTDREIIDMTSMNAQQIADAGPVIEVGQVDAAEPALTPRLGGNTYSPDSFTINHAGRASSNDTLEWGQRNQQGVKVWSSTLRLATYVSLQTTLHPFHLNYQSLGGRQIFMTTTVQMRKHNRLAGDGVVDTNYWEPGAYGTGYAATKNLLTPKGEGKYFPSLTMSLLDKAAGGGRFTVGGTINYPRFQCYKTTTCKYPNGKEAAW